MQKLEWSVTPQERFQQNKSTTLLAAALCLIIFATIAFTYQFLLPLYIGIGGIVVIIIFGVFVRPRTHYSFSLSDEGITYVRNDQKEHFSWSDIHGYNRHDSWKSLFAYLSSFSKGVYSEIENRTGVGFVIYLKKCYLFLFHKKFILHIDPQEVQAQDVENILRAHIPEVSGGGAIINQRFNH